jgi:hypothetical protein
MLKELEPWCSDIYGDWVGHKGFHVNKYIEQEQPNTQYNLSEKFGTRVPDSPIYDIKVVFNPWELTQQSFQILTQLPKIIKDSGEEGQRFQLDIFDIWIEQMVEHQEDNIVCDSN